MGRRSSAGGPTATGRDERETREGSEIRIRIRIRIRICNPYLYPYLYPFLSLVLSFLNARMRYLR